MDGVIHIDVRTCDLTLTEVLREIDRIQEEHPDHEVFLDGDTHTIMSRPRPRMPFEVVL